MIDKSLAARDDLSDVYKATSIPGAQQAVLLYN